MVHLAANERPDAGVAGMVVHQGPGEEAKGISTSTSTSAATAASAVARRLERLELGG